MFLSTAAFILLVVYSFDPIVIEILSVQWLRNKSRVSVQISDYMEDIYIHVLNRTDKQLIGVCQSRV